jgi:hypothetical protein
MRRRDFIAWTAATALWRVPARAQSKRHKIGWLVFGDPNLGPVDHSLKNALLEASIADGPLKSFIAMQTVEPIG